VSVKDDNIASFSSVLSDVFDASSLESSQIEAIAIELAETAVRVELGGSKELVTVKYSKGKPPQAVHYRPREAIAIIVHVVELTYGIAEQHYVLVGAAVLGCLHSLKGIQRAIPPAEAALLCLIYYSDDAKISRAAAAEKFSEYCLERSEIKPAEFSSALRALCTMQIVEERKGILHLRETVRISGIAPIFERG